MFWVTLYGLSFLLFLGCSLFFCDAIDALSFFAHQVIDLNFVFKNVIVICVLAYASFISLWTGTKIINQQVIQWMAVTYQIIKISIGII